MCFDQAKFKNLSIIAGKKNKSKIGASLHIKIYLYAHIIIHGCFIAAYKH